VSPNTSYGAYLSKATYDSPTESFHQFYYIDLDLQEFWIYNKSTGKIIGKIKQKDFKTPVSGEVRRGSESEGGQALKREKCDVGYS
jgi:hypothetical protein